MLRISEKRLRANRANAAKSTGPKTPEGKVRCSLNAIRHGLLAKQILVGSESAEGFKTLCDLLVQRFAPVDGFEYNMIEELAASYWRLRRVWSVETEMLERAMENKTDRGVARTASAFSDLAGDRSLATLHRYESRLHGMYQRTLRNLLLVRQLEPSRNPETPVCQAGDGTQPAICTNEAINPNPCNVFVPVTAEITRDNARKLPVSVPPSAPELSPPSPKGPSGPPPTPSSQKSEPSDIISS